MGCLLHRDRARKPEPAIWAMMVAGFDLVGFAMGGRRKTAARLTSA
ncbi:PEPxxWA-CTERM sorting domain-containing protein [Sphingomonas sp. Leaf357]|nr:PEPxxWA-CTERM sorting domain-containing protein [Sphingomonas sp. Leaf357]